MHYNAFISYRHSEIDTFVAENIHKKLENFKLPASVRKKTGLGKNCIERVFRDTEELALADNLSDEIYQLRRGQGIVPGTGRVWNIRSLYAQMCV
ncbi:MAG: hypothetical protein K6G24_12305 [Lachnospiraceae bacterium]|nr:hypothetical protein [Lachnospiraceae bacterium]